MTQKKYFEKLESFEKNNWEGYDEWFINNANMEVVTEEKTGTVTRKGIKFKGRGKKLFYGVVEGCCGLVFSFRYDEMNDRLFVRDYNPNNDVE